MITCLTNWHHSNLILSFYLLCQRMNWKLCLMHGMDWYEMGYFKMYPNPRKTNPEEYFAQRYLKEDLDLLYRRQPEFPKIEFLTLQQAMNTPIDILLCSNREMENPMAKFRQDFHPEAKMLRQVGNKGDIVNTETYPHCLYSDLESYNENSGNKILYHQEFDLETFHFELPKENMTISTFQNNFRDYEPAEKFSYEIQMKFPNYKFKEYGRDNYDGFIFPINEVANKMREANFLWQIKNWDGYSHYIHDAFAIGRPMIVQREDIKGKIFEPLFDETTCIFTDNLERIRTVGQWEMSTNCHNRFTEVVNFDEEFNSRIKPFLENIL